jgi:hypothetical protein
MNGDYLSVINEEDQIIKTYLSCNREELSLFLNNVYKIGKNNGYSKLEFWKESDVFSMLSIYAIYLIYSLMYDNKLEYKDFDLVEAIKCIYEDMTKGSDTVILRDMKYKYIMKIYQKIILKKKKENTMNLKYYLQKKLSISEKEASLIQSITEEYARNKKRNFKEYALFKDMLIKDIDDNLSLIDPRESYMDFFDKLSVEYPAKDYQTVLNALDTPKYRKDYNEVIAHYDRLKDSKKESTLSLSRYLQKRLNINFKEAQYIESMYRDFSKKKI